MTNENDDWEVAVDTGEFDKRIEQQEKDRAAIQESISSTVNDDDDNRNASNINLIISNKPIRILKRPTSQSQLPVSNDINNSPFSNEISSSTTVPVISIIPRNQIKDSINSSSTINSSNSSSIKSTIKTYEQREQEYRLARLRIMGEEESSAKDDDDDNDNNNHSTIDSTSITSDEILKTTFSSQQPLQNQVNYALNAPTNAIHFTPNTIGPFSQQQYRAVYTPPYPPMPLSRYPPSALYMSSSSSNYPIQSASNPWYQYQQQQQQTPYETQQYSHPQ